MVINVGNVMLLFKGMWGCLVNFFKVYMLLEGMIRSVRGDCV